MGEGMAQFGIYPHELPRVLLMEGPDRWVEDVQKFTVMELPGNLERLEDLWRMREGAYGQLLWWARHLVRSYRELDNLAVAHGGAAGRTVAPVLVVALAAYLSYLMKIICLGVFDFFR